MGSGSSIPVFGNTNEQKIQDYLKVVRQMNTDLDNGSRISDGEFQSKIQTLRETLACGARAVPHRKRKVISQAMQTKARILRNKARDNDVRQIFNEYMDPSSSRIPRQQLDKALLAAGTNASEVELLRTEILGDADFDTFRSVVLAPSFLEMWARSLPLAPILAAALPRTDDSDPIRRISAMSREEIAIMVESYCEALKPVIEEHVAQLRDVYSAEAQQVDSAAAASKFQVGQMNCGNISDFHNGLQRRIGTCHLKFMAGMRAEHCELAGRDHTFTSTNYGVTTTPRREWEVVMGSAQCSPEELRGGRRVPDAAALLQSPTALDSKLTEPEVVAVVLYTGPMVPGPAPADSSPSRDFPPRPPPGSRCAPAPAPPRAPRR